ncbi:DUF1508 domain-containing protein [Halorubellus sp. JP-L1]|uniref:HVO_2922 family protein n=1 Tax=Halorubellus sp. JP-L1 TaxID=2715753 RepID=UPI00140BEB37|nr:HVO_2922 family protein [Halorubellus sp. JP-L1]NHN41622.1 DUF1508 domain-containing protein [Halorubellus sp. JP-L1]
MSDEPLYKTTQTATRKAIASYLHNVANAFDSGDAVPVADSVTVTPPGEVEMEVDVEREGDESSYEVEFAWPAADGDVDTDADVAASGIGSDAVDADAESPDDAGAGGDDADAAGEREATEEVAETVPAGSKATFEIYRDRANEWRWRLRHDNGNVIADSGEGYDRKAGARNGIESVQRNAAGADVDEQS